MNKLTIDDLSPTGKRALVRVDFNVPLTESGEVEDDTRITASLPTLKKILESGGSAVVMSHLGRPKAKREEKYSLRPVAERLTALTSWPVRFVSDCIGSEVESAARSLKGGELLLIDNVRFYPGEEANDPDFAAQLARLGDYYVNDAFGSAHRAHASTHAVAGHFPGRAVAGYLMEKELSYLGQALAEPKRPFVAVIGGAKISTKIDVLKNLLGKVDRLLIGGAMTYTLIKARGGQIGKSLCEVEKLDVAREIMALPEASKILLPVDSTTALNVDATCETEHEGRRFTHYCWRFRPSDQIPDEEIGFDIGPDAVAEFTREIAQAGTVVWNGPVGMFERDLYATGTRAVAESLAMLTGKGGVTVVGGGDSVAALEKFGLANRMSHVSTGGGASLEFLEGRVLPGVAALTDR
ncbi:MAG: phosphoglycerate kinase [Calditrichaeota bacterium]|nr:phosphoglycerate kinase [Calditrichota bacterium]